MELTFGLGMIVGGVTGYVLGFYWFKKLHVHEIANHQIQQKLNPK